MKNKIDKLLDYLVASFLLVSVIIGAIWFVKFSGIIWSPDSLVPSAWNSALALAKKWGPLFIPAATMIFVAKTFQRNISLEVGAALEPKIRKTVTEAINDSLNSNINQKLRGNVLTSIRSVYRGLLSENKHKKEKVDRMYQTSLRDYCLENDHKLFNIPANL